MAIKLKIYLFLVFLSIVFTSGIVVFSQPLGLEPKAWATELDKPKMSEPNSLRSLTQQLLEEDSVQALLFWDTLENIGKSKGYYFRTRFCMTKADYLFKRLEGITKFKDRNTKSLSPIKDDVKKLYAVAIDAAYHTEDEHLIGWASFYSARLMRHLGETGWAVMYSKNGVELLEKDGYAIEPNVYTWLSELLWDIKEYEESYTVAQKAIATWAAVTEPEYKEKWLQEYHARAWNALALNYCTRKQYDSARVCLAKALKIAQAVKDTLWTGIVQVHTGKVLYYQKQWDSAATILDSEYYHSISAGNYDNAAYAANWAARTHFARGNLSQALLKARNAKHLLHLWPNSKYLRDTYSILTQLFRATQMYDSAFYYNDRYMVLHDSLEKAVATSSLAISRARLNDEISRFNIQKLNREKREVTLWRNFIIAFILSGAIIALLMVNRQLLKEKMKSQQAEQERIQLTLHVEAAQAEIQHFTANLLEKSTLLEQLQQEKMAQENNQERHEMVANLGKQTILTPENWEEFKRLFEEAYPGFFNHLLSGFPGITLAEQRMAALIRLALTAHQMASILGISSDSVRKSRQRLRQRFKVSNDTQLNEMIAQL